MTQPSSSPYGPFQPQPQPLPYPPTPPVAPHPGFQMPFGAAPSGAAPSAVFPAAPQAGRTIPMGLFLTVLAVTAVLASGLALVGVRWVVEARDGGPAAGPARAVTAKGTGSAVSAGSVAAADPVSSRLAITRPRQLLDAHTAPGAERVLPLPSMRERTTAVLLQVSVIDAGRPGLVTVRSAAEDLPALRVGARGGQSSGTVVAVLGADRRLRVRTEPGGRLVVQLIGTFEASRRSSWGRIVVTPPHSVVRLRPIVDGHDAVLDLGGVPAFRHPGRVSAVLLRFAGEVGSHGGYVAVGRSRHQLDQRVLWSATSGADLIRNGLMVVPVSADRPDRLYLHYKAGTELRAEEVGYVTGPDATATGTGLGVPVRAQQAPAVRVAAAGRRNVQLVPDRGVAGVRPGRVAAALTYLSVTSREPGPVSLLARGGRPTSIPDLSAAAKARSALALSGVSDGRVSLVSRSDAAVILTPRLLILR